MAKRPADEKKKNRLWKINQQNSDQTDLKYRCGKCVHGWKHTKCTLEMFVNDLCTIKGDHF